MERARHPSQRSSRWLLVGGLAFGLLSFAGQSAAQSKDKAPKGAPAKSAKPDGKAETIVKPRSGVPILGPGGAAPASRPATPTSRPATPTSRPAGATSQPSSRPASQPTSQPAKVAKKLPKWAPKLRATIKPAAAHVGDPIRVSITTQYKKGISVTLPLKLELGDFAELSRKERRKESGAEGHIPDVEHVFELEVGAYKLGRLSLPPIEINALGPGGELVTLKTPTLPIQIKSVMPNEPKPKLKDVEEPVRVFQRTWWLLYLLLVLGIIGITATVTLIVRRRMEARRRAERPAPPPPPPHDVALRRLAALDVDAYISEERFKELYLELSEIVREYIGGRFDFDALEMTTTEINETLEARQVSLALRQQLSTYFNDCDLVKFARFRPEDELAREAAREAEQLVRDTTAAWGLPPVPAARTEAETPASPAPASPAPASPAPASPAPASPAPASPAPAASGNDDDEGAR